MRVLWLCSWYPSEIDRFDGDFIQRHAHAAALFNDIYVIHIAADDKGKVTDHVKKEVTTKGRLTECIVYFKKTTSFLGKVNGFLKWRRLFSKTITEYIELNGVPDLVHVHVPMRSGLLALSLKRKYKIAYLVSEHWTIYQPGTPRSFSKQSPVFKFLTRRIIKASDLLLTVSEDLGRRINEQVVAKQFLVVPNVANETLFFYEPVQEMPFVFIHVSNMSYQKNVRPIVACFHTFYQEFPNSQLILVGRYEKSLLGAAKETGLLNKSIFFRGEISYDEVARELRHANVLVLFSYFENLPCVIIEALSCGRPVITTAVGGIPEIVDEHNGLFVTINDSTSLIKAMRQMMSQYRFLDLKKISLDATSKFSYTAVGALFDNIYRKTLGEKQRLL
ncbi:MAG TPA: glycosyltransferase [Chitinophagaceae bacterium]|nr:glycosyltransferase [Chitinophagaceae bacterium]